jgi:hypothetical protein
VIDSLFVTEIRGAATPTQKECGVSGHPKDLGPERQNFTLFCSGFNARR